MSAEKIKPQFLLLVLKLSHLKKVKVDKSKSLPDCQQTNFNHKKPRSQKESESGQELELTGFSAEKIEPQESESEAKKKVKVEKSKNSPDCQQTKLNHKKVKTKPKRK